jgi:DNA polymerase-1
LHSNENKAWDCLSEMFERIFDRFETRDHIICFSSPPSFRYKVDATYKNNRASSRKPLCYGLMKERVEAEFRCKDFPELEADDVMGILATKGSKKQTIIVSQDKDMKTIPTTIWDGKDLLHVTEAEADTFHLWQTLVGDTSDGYKGCPGIGKVKADKLLGAAEGDTTLMWAVVKGAYEKAGLTEDDAIQQARLARILRHSDWDGENKQPILWSPNG